MVELLENFGAVATSVIGMAGETVTFVVSNPILLVPVAFGFFAAGVGLVKKFI